MEDAPIGITTSPDEDRAKGPSRGAESERAIPDAGTDRGAAPLTADRVVARLRAGLGVVTVLVGVAAVVVSGLVAVAPVEATTSTITWPRGDDDPQRPTPTTAFLVPYRPAELHADIPCTALREARARDGTTTVLATTTSGTTRGLVVRSDEGRMRLLVDGRAQSLELPPGDCAMRVDADTTGQRAVMGGRTVLERPGGPVPEVFAITTDLTGPSAQGLGVLARTPSWFDNTASSTKSGLITVQLQLAVVALGLLVLLGVLDGAITGRVSLAGWRLDTGAAGRTDARAGVRAGVRAGLERAGRRAVRRGAEVLRRPRPWALSSIDVGVVVGLVWWSVVGPTTDDDGFATIIARSAADGGPVGNYYRWFDAAEAPFASSQQLLGVFLDAGGDPLALRLPSVLAGVAVWVLVTRGVLGAGLAGRAGSSVLVRAATAVCFAAWWLPYDLGERPEPMVAAGATAVVVLVLRAIRPEAHHPRSLLAVAVGVAALTTTVAPSGLLAVAPFLLAPGRVLRIAYGGRTGLAAAVRLVESAAVGAGLAGVAVVVVFARQSWHGVVVATSIHQQFGPSQPWYAEWLRYGYLLGNDEWGSATKRVPVLLAIVLLVPAVTLLARRGRAALGAVGAESVVLLGLAPVGLALLAVTPSKWSHHFGALAGFGAVSAVAVLVALVRSAQRLRSDPVLRVVGPVTSLGIAAAAAASFAGPNTWWGYSTIDIPWSTTPVLPATGLGRWLTVAVAAVLVTAPVLALRRRRARRADTGPGSGPISGPGDVLTTAGAAAPIMLAPLVAAASVAVLVVSFGSAADPSPGTWTLGARNLAVARAPGSTAGCGLQDRVQVLSTVPGGPLPPATGSDQPTATLDGFVERGGWEDPPPDRPGQSDDARDARYAWGSKGDGDTTVGSLTSQWFVLPRERGLRELALDVAGRTDDGASVTVEYGRSGREGTTTLDRRALAELPEPQRGYRGYAADEQQARLQDQNRSRSTWRTLTVPAIEIPPEADRVRVLARDDRSDVGGWIAVTGPRLVDVIPLSQYLAGRGPVVVDWAIAFAWPCLGDLASVGRGLAQTPRVLITTPPAIGDPLPGQSTVDDTRPDDVVPERWTLGTDGLITSTDPGGSFAGMRQVADLEELDTRLAGDASRVWGRVLIPDYRSLRRDNYDIRATTLEISGTAGDPPPIRDPRPPPGPQP